MWLLSRSPHARLQALARAASPDYLAWREHITPAAGCTRPILLAGQIVTIQPDTGRVLSTVDTASMPDGVIYKPCGNRRASVCPSCSKRYQRDAYQVVRSGLAGGNGIPDHVAQHPAVFATFTAPSFGPVHTRIIRRHTCESRSRCDCRPEPCHPRRDERACPHGTPAACWARHTADDSRVGTPLCGDCYDHAGQVVWNLRAGELWRRTAIAIRKHIRRLARQRGIHPATVRVAVGKAAEMQRRAVVHFHAILRLDGANPDDPTQVLPPPAGFTPADLVDAIQHAATVTSFHTATHPAQPEGWPMRWGVQLDTRVITMTGAGEVTDQAVAGYLAKYATKSTEVTGHTSGRITDQTVNLYSDPDGNHTQRLIEACWTLGTPSQWRLLRRWAHMLGFGGHFLTKSRTYSVTFTVLRQRRITCRRAQTTGPEPSTKDTVPSEPANVVANWLQYVGAGWHTTGDAMLANTSAALAREHHHAALTEIATLTA